METKNIICMENLNKDLYKNYLLPKFNKEIYDFKQSINLLLSNETKSEIAEFCQTNTSVKATDHFGLSLSTIKKYRKYQG